MSNYFASEPQIEAGVANWSSWLVHLKAPKSTSATPVPKAMRLRSKLAKLYGRTLAWCASPRIGGKPARILALTHGFHGRTMGALSATWKPGDPQAVSSRWCRTSNSCAPATRSRCTRRSLHRPVSASYGKGPVAAVILELIQGEAGVQSAGRRIT